MQESARVNKSEIRSEIRLRNRVRERKREREMYKREREDLRD